MDITRWTGRVAVVTGASAGIGAAIVLDLCKNGIKTIGLARRVEKIQDLRSQLKADEQRNLFAIKCDVTKESEVIRVFHVIEQRFGGIDILINNAGIRRSANIIDESGKELVQSVIDTNLMAAINCTREAVKSMKARNSEGYVIHINSVAGHFHPYRGDVRGGGMYHASKFGLRALAEQHRHEFTRQKLNIKVASISPGLVDTEIFYSLGEEYTKEAIEMLLKTHPILKSKDISNGVIYLLSTPPHVNICELTIRPLHEVL